MENAISKFLIWGGGGKFGVENAIESRIWGVENLGWKMLSRISNLGGGGKFWVENAVSNLEFGGWKIWGGKCYLEISNWGGGGVENLGWKMLSRMSNLGGGKFGVENAISNLQFGWVENLGWIMLFESRIWGWKIWGGKCYLESRIWGVDNLGWKMLS